MNARPPGLEHDSATAATRAWVERAIIGLNLCPFAKADYLKDQVRFVVSEARRAGALLEELSAGGDGARWEQAVAMHTAT